MKGLMLIAVFAAGLASISACGAGADRASSGSSGPAVKGVDTEAQALVGVATTLGIGTLPSFRAIHARPSPTDLTLIHRTFDPGAVGAFHYNTGETLVVVAAGTFTEDDGCGGINTFAAGSAVQQKSGPKHVVRLLNNGSDTLDLYIVDITDHGQPPNVVTGPPDCKPKDGGDDSEDD